MILCSWNARFLLCKTNLKTQMPSNHAQKPNNEYEIMKPSRNRFCPKFERYCRSLTCILFKHNFASYNDKCLLVRNSNRSHVLVPNFCPKVHFCTGDSVTAFANLSVAWAVEDWQRGPSCSQSMAPQGSGEHKHRVHRALAHQQF